MNCNFLVREVLHRTRAPFLRMDNKHKKLDNDLRRLINSFILPLIMGAVLVILHILVEFDFVNSRSWAVYPRSSQGAIGIFTAAFFHGDWEHLFSNLIPLVILGAGIRFFYRMVSLSVILLSIIIPGLGVWLIGRSSYHLGASGMVYSFVFFLFFSGVFRKDRVALVLSLLVAFGYGSVVWGILPIQEGVSWESHLVGAIIGVLMAWIFKEVNRPPKRKEQEDTPDYSGPFWNYKDLIPPPEGFEYPE